MKRIFIAVGSEALKGVAALIKRLSEENLFNRFHDQYIAIDSDRSKVESFNAIAERLRTDRVKGFVLELDPSDDVIMKSLQPRWNASAIPAGGVGGVRSISGKAMKMIRRIWTDPNIGLDDKLESSDEIAVVGTAFGGTSGGMFMNVCEFLDLQIRNRKGGKADSPFKNVKISGFLLMPEAVVPAEEHGYRLDLNIVNMFRDIQTSSWRRRLEITRRGFKVPVWAHYDGQSFNLFNSQNEGGLTLLEYGVEGSTLPMTNLYVIPTLHGKRSFASEQFAETLFTAEYLAIDHGQEQTVDRLLRANEGPCYHASVEDPCFCGFNMFVMKSGRLITLKNWFWRKIIDAIAGTNGRGGLLGKEDSHPYLPDNVRNVFQKAQTPDREDQYAGIKLEDCGPLRTLIEKERLAIVNEKSLNEFASQLRQYLVAVADAAPNYSPVRPKALMLLLSATAYNEWNGEMNFETIRKGYRQFYSDLKQQANSCDTYAENIVKSLETARRIIATRRQSRVVREWALGLHKEEEVFAEVSQAFDAKFRALLHAYLLACRCARTAVVDEATFNREVEEYSSKCEALKDTLSAKCEALKGRDNPYIVDGNLIENLHDLPEPQKSQLGFEPLKVAMSVVYRQLVTDHGQNDNAVKMLAKVAGDNNDWLSHSSFDHVGVLEMAEEQMVNKYLRLAADLMPGADPLTDATLADFSTAKARPCKCKTYSEAFAVTESCKGNYHFVISLGKKPNRFQMTNDDVAGSLLNLRTMPNCGNPSAEFLAIDHSNGIADIGSWKSESTPTSPIFEGMEDGAAARDRVQGLWIGTLGVRFTVNDVLRRLYDNHPAIQRSWITAADNDMESRRVMTLSEMVKFGVIMEAIQTKVNEVWTAHRKKPGCENDEIAGRSGSIEIVVEQGNRKVVLAQGSLSAIGFTDDASGSGCGIEKISPEQASRIMKWIRGNDGDSFSSFFPQVVLQTLKNCETNIFKNMRLSITDDEIREMDQAKLLIMKSLVIKGL